MGRWRQSFPVAEAMIVKAEVPVAQSASLPTSPSSATIWRSRLAFREAACPESQKNHSKIGSGCYFCVFGISGKHHVMKRYGFALFAALAALSGQSAAADLKLASWNLGWHLSQAEAKNWIAACDAAYELNNATKTWVRSGKAEATPGWELDWRPRDAAIQLPWTIEKLPPCSVYEDDNRKVVHITQGMFKIRAQRISKILASMDPDVIAFQEVSGEAAVKEVLGNAAGKYRVCSYAGYSVQRLAFAWKKNLTASKGVCETRDDLSLPQNGKERRPRPGLSLSLDINGKKTAFLNVHLKSSCVSPFENNEQHRGQLESDQRDCVILQQQIQPLENWIEKTSESHDRFIVMGDFNRDLWHEQEKAKSTAARVDGSAPSAMRDPKLAVRLLLPEINDDLPTASSMTLVAATCEKSGIANELCSKAKHERLSSPDWKKLGEEMGCRNPAGLDQMLVSNNWQAGSATSNAKKISIAPYGSSGSTVNDKGIAETSIAVSDHCPTRIVLPL